MNLTGILKSLLLVASSVILWSTPITLTQAIGYSIALAGMFYYALPPDSPPPHRLLFARAARLFGAGRGLSRAGVAPSSDIQLGSVRGGSGGGEYGGGRAGHDHEDSFLLKGGEDDDDGGGGMVAETARARRRSEPNINPEKLASHVD